MTKEPYFICSDCGSNVLAVSQTWKNRTEYEEVGFIGQNGNYTFDEPVTVEEEDMSHEWLAYCGGCGKGVTVEWLSKDRVRVLLTDDVTD